MRQSGAYERVFLGIAITVTLVWALATIVQVIKPEHLVPTYANLVMMSVAGCFFGGAVLSSRKRNGNGNGNGAGGKTTEEKSILDAALDAAKKKAKR